MSDFSQSHFAHVVETAKENGETLAKGIELCFGQPCTIEAGEAAPLPETGERDETFEQPGLVVGMRAGETGLVALLPESFPLPDWYKQPDETELSRMQTLGMEWSMCLFPEELMADEYTAAAFPSLNEAIQLLTPDAEAQWLPLTVTIEGAETPGVMYLLGAVQHPCFTPEAEQADEAETASTESGEQQSPPEELLEGEFSLEERQHRAARVSKLPVSVTVRLAEKRIEMSQLQTLSPGSLIMFSKNCEELLDLYVNNTPYCRGEVVKVGENFGLKVDEVGYYIEREQKII